MDPREILRDIVAKLTETPAEQIGPDFPLHSHGLQSSGRRAALAAAIRRKIGGIDNVPDSARTFGELEQIVFSPRPPLPLPAPAAPRQSAPLSCDKDDHSVRCGLDIENVADLPEAPDYREHEFYQTIFTSEEIAYCIAQENPRMHFAARWCAKEALIKCDPAFRAEKLSSIEVVRQDTGAVCLRHHTSGTARKLAHGVSLTHTNSIAAACVVLAPGIPCGNGAPSKEVKPAGSPISSILMNEVYLYGAGGISKIIYEILLSMGKQVKGIFDDDPPNAKFRNLQVRPGIGLVGKDNFPPLDAPVVISVGNNARRAEIARMLNAQYGTAIHTSVLISPTAVVGPGTIILHGSIVQAGTRLGAHVLVNTGASIDHDCIVGDYAHVSSRATLCGHVEVGEGSDIGAGAVVIHCVRVGKWCRVGAGAVVLHDVPDYTTVVGNPARVLKRSIPTPEDLESPTQSGN